MSFVSGGSTFPTAGHGGSVGGGAGIGVASQQILPVNASRMGVLFINDSPNIIYLHKGPDPAVLNTGIRLNPNGGSWQEDIALTSVWKGQWHAIATVAASNLCINEDF